MISGVLARSVTSRAPLLGADTDQVEKWTHVLGGYIEKYFEACTRWRQLCICRRGVEDRRGPRGELAVRPKASIEVDPAKVSVTSEITKLDTDAAAVPIYDLCGPGFGLGAGAPT